MVYLSSERFNSRMASVVNKVTFKKKIEQLNADLLSVVYCNCVLCFSLNYPTIVEELGRRTRGLLVPP